MYWKLAVPEVSGVAFQIIQDHGSMSLLQDPGRCLIEVIGHERQAGEYQAGSKHGVHLLIDNRGPKAAAHVCIKLEMTRG